MRDKNIFRWFLFLFLLIVVAKLCYNLGYRAVTQKLSPVAKTTAPKTSASRAAEDLRGVTADPADSVGAAQMATPPQ